MSHRFLELEALRKAGSLPLYSKRATVPRHDQDMEGQLSVLQVSAADSGGGADLVAQELFQGLGKRGLSSLHLVGRKSRQNPKVIGFSHDDARGLIVHSFVAAARSVSPMVGKVPPARDE